MENNPNKIIVQIDITATTALCIIAQLQLAFRHPDNNDVTKKITMAFVRGIQQELIRVIPEFEDIINAGWNFNDYSKTPLK